MFKKWLASFVVSAALTGVSASAAEQIVFDQPGNFMSVMSSLRTVADKSSPALEGTEDTFQLALEPVEHAKGLVKKELPNASWKSFKNSRVDIPNVYDLRLGLTQIENQGACGSCWAFSLTATHRDGYALAGKDPGRLSQEWLTEHSPESAGCQGGYFDSANDFVYPGGQPLWSDCPYKQGAGKCPAALPFAAHITAWYMLGEKGSSPSIKDIEAYMTISGKPVSIDVAAGAGRWESYSGGVYNGCTSGQVDHMINIVGWDNEGATFDKNGNLPPGKGIWILRNSWGKSWGEQGYMRSKMTSASGKRCNAVAEDAAAFDFPLP